MSETVTLADIHVDTDSIPFYVRDQLCEATMQLVRNILKQPGGREMLDRETAARKAAQAARERGDGA